MVSTRMPWQRNTSPRGEWMCSNYSNLAKRMQINDVSKANRDNGIHLRLKRSKAAEISLKVEQVGNCKSLPISILFSLT